MHTCREGTSVAYTWQLLVQCSQIYNLFSEKCGRYTDGAVEFCDNSCSFASLVVTQLAADDATHFRHFAIVKSI